MNTVTGIKSTKSGYLPELPKRRDAKKDRFVEYLLLALAIALVAFWLITSK